MGERAAIAAARKHGIGAAGAYALQRVFAEVVGVAGPGEDGAQRSVGVFAHHQVDRNADHGLVVLVNHLAGDAAGDHQLEIHRGHVLSGREH